MKNVLKLLAIIVPVFLIGYFLESSRQISSVLGGYFEISTELLSIVLSFSIFVITWYAYGKSGDNHSLFLGSAFFLTGLLGLYHMFSLPFMPDFITPNSAQKSTIFWIETQLISALLFLASAYVHKNTLPEFINKPALSASIVTLSFASLIAGLFYPYYLPVVNYYPHVAPSSTLIFLELTTAAILIYTGYLYARRFRESGQKHIICLIYSFIIILFSNIVYISYDYAGHLLKAASFYFVYFALYRSSVEQPFEMMTEAEAKLRREAEERYKNLVDNANDAIITTDLDDNITSWNPGAEKTFGFTAREVMGKKLSQLIVPPNQRAGNEYMIHDIISGGKTGGVDAVRVCRDGSMIDVNVILSPLRDMDRNIIGFSSIIRDMTERKRAEEIRLENARLAIAIKAKSEFLTDMSHDLGTPLNHIIGFSELLKRKIAGELNKKQEHYVDCVLTSSRHLLYIINDVLDLGRAEAGKIKLVFEKIPVRAAIEEAVNLVKEKAVEHNVILREDIDPRVDFIEADRQRFKQILFNLLDNAIKFSKESRGTVTIAAKKEGDMAKISVSDTGTGIREEDMGKLFKEFEQLDSGISKYYEGTGLGLVISKKLVELHGGKILADSRYGEGSTFTIILPLISKK